MKKFLVLLFLMAIGTRVFAQSIATDRGYIDVTHTAYGHFESVDGVLYVLGSDPKVLVKFPQNKNVATYTVLDKTSSIARGAFQGNKYIQTVRIPSSVQYIGDNAFEGCENLKTIEVYEVSSAIQAAEMNEVIEKEEIGRYNINGVKIEEADGGIQIILYSDGTADKVLKNP